MWAWKVDREAFEKIINSGGYEAVNDCRVFLGLQVLRKYVPDAGISGANHDIVYSSVSIDDLIGAGITQDDAKELNRLNWMVDEDGDSLSKFV